MFPPGRARLVTMPVTTGSPGEAITIGIVLVPFLAARGIRSDRRHDDVDLQPNQVGHQPRGPIVPTVSIARLDRDVLALDPAEVAETSPETLVPRQALRRGIGRQKAYPIDLPRFLRLRGKQRGKGTSQRGQQEAAPVHYSMT
jgi:hypothetical protein